MQFLKQRIVGFCLLPGFLVIAMGQVSLLDSARREMERRNSVDQEAPLYTNHELPRLQKARVSLVADQVRRGELPADEPNRMKEETAGEDRWPSRVGSARGRVDAAVNRLHVLQLRHNYLRNLYFNASEEVQRMRLEGDLRALMEELKLAEVEERNAREAWDVIRTEAIRAGVNPGTSPPEVVLIDKMESTKKP